MTASAAPRGRCPNCGAPTDAKYRPFCSARCKNVDLHRWLKGSYAIPAVEADDAGEDEDAAGGGSRPH